MTKRMKEFQPGHGFTQKDWDAVDSPELTDEELAGLKPANEVLPTVIFESVIKRRRGQRGAQKTPTKALISLRLDQDIIDRFKAEGPGWQSRINEALRKALAA